jgi:hypothetical protein
LRFLEEELEGVVEEVEEGEGRNKGMLVREEEVKEVKQTLRLLHLVIVEEVFLGLYLVLSLVIFSSYYSQI